MSPAANASKVRILGAIMFMRKAKLPPSAFLAHSKALENFTAKYPINRVVCKTLTIPSAVIDVNQEKLFSVQIPTCIVIGLVRNNAFNGSTIRNPFNFQHFTLTEISVYSHGQQQRGIKLWRQTLNTNCTWEGSRRCLAETVKRFETKVTHWIERTFLAVTRCMHSTWRHIWVYVMCNIVVDTRQ